MARAMSGLRFAAASAVFAFLVMVAPAAAQQNCGNDKPVGNAQNCPHGPSLSATPELDSLVLFGGGLLGVGGYALMRIRARRRSE